MSPAAIVGTVAAVCSVTAFLPQAWKVIRTRRTEDLATSMWILQVVAFAAWIGYGVVLRELPIIIPNVICVLLSAFILLMKLLPRAKREAVANAVDHALPGT